MKKLLVGTSLFLLFLLFGGAWVSVVRFIPAGLPRTVAAIAFGTAFAGFFFWLLVERLQSILTGVHRLWTHVVQVAVIVLLTILAFTFVYSKLGIKSAETGEVTRDFVACAYSRSSPSPPWASATTTPTASDARWRRSRRSPAT